MTRIEEVNALLGISDDMNVLKNKNIVFIYCPPKVGSTTLVSSIRLNACGKYTVIHLHNEMMLVVLYGIRDIKVIDIINYNSSLGKNVYVIDIYRSPIEQMISSFFENIEIFHFNAKVDEIQKYDINKLIRRFNNLFPHLQTLDYFRNLYDVTSPDNFDFNKKMICADKNGIKYFKIRLKDSSDWSNILKDIFGFTIYIINDYETRNKPINNVYNQFKEQYKIPINFMDIVENDTNLMYYYNETERNEYLNFWRSKVDGNFTPFTIEEYDFYTKISADNQYLNIIDTNHYLDYGCLCNACCRKRSQILYKLSKGENVEDRIIHSNEVVEYIRDKVKRAASLIKRVKRNNRK
jgi:hypothetical protein